jgi:hypothetical protein
VTTRIEGSLASRARRPYDPIALDRLTALGYHQTVLIESGPRPERHCPGKGRINADAPGTVARTRTTRLRLHRRGCRHTDTDRSAQQHAGDAWSPPCHVAHLSVFGVFSIAAAFSPNATTLIVLRVLAGIGLGGELPIAVSYLGDLLPAAVRGLWTAIAFAVSYLGVPAVGLLGVGLVDHAPLGFAGCSSSAGWAPDWSGSPA